ncbi:cytochrome P450 2J4-like [Physella acuta]|uniref:cytochrome P450 2J4-like n=1 Tax=Physella acuta TaxID=109671 RepID=UPI0027DBEA2F|nr:cytochrome P450 2J4-like [Physella acuta]
MLTEYFSSTFSPWVFTITLCILIVFKWTRKSKNLPPSPGISLPIIGHLYLLDAKNSRKKFKEWSQKLGPVFSLEMGKNIYIIVNNLELLKKVTVKQADTMAGRSTADLLSVNVPAKNKGIVFSSGPLWKEQRSTAMNILKYLGMGKNILAEKITQEVLMYAKELSKQNGAPFNISKLTTKSVSNIIHSVIYGFRYDYDDPRLKTLVDTIEYVVGLASTVNLINIIPSLIYLPFDFFGAKLMVEKRKEFHKNTERLVETIAKDFDPENIDNFIVAYIQEMKMKEQSGKPTYLSYESLARSVDDMFVAGTDTTATTIVWCLLYSIHHPDKQDIMYQEILEHVGTERVPNMMDKQNLKYVNAFIYETQRIASILPIITYECTADTSFETYTIPKGTQIATNLDLILRDKKIWGDPENFRPGRFIDVEGKLRTPEEFIPYSVGRRVCIGESLARMEMYLYMAILFQKFKILPEDANNMPSLEDTAGLTAPPLPYRLRAVPRLN